MRERKMIIYTGRSRTVLSVCEMVHLAVDERHMMMVR